jgi:tripartite-type tricarboxylate transporter receptor subunit TctC
MRISRWLIVVRLAIACAVLAVVAQAARAADYPSRPIHLVVAYPAGTATDLAARQIVPKLAELLGTQVIVDNRGGAGGIVGTEAVAHAAPDGYTLLFATGQTQAINLSLYAKLPYDPIKDFTPIARVAETPMVLVVPPSLGVHSVAELVALAKANPGKLNYASSGAGSSAHLCGALLASEAGINIAHVPYTSAAQGFTDLMNGEISMMFYPYLPFSPLIQAHKLDPIATTSAERPPYLADVPTMVQSGYPDFLVSPWFAIYGPAELPRPIVDKLAAAIDQTLQDPAVKQRLLATGTDAFFAGPDALAQFTRDEIERYRKFVALSGAKVE